MKCALSPRLYLLLLLWATLPCPADAQQPRSPQSDAILSYTTSLTAETRLYNGTLYLGYDHHAKGHPFFLSDTLLTASAEYDGIFFPKIDLSYDMVKDVVTIPNKQNTVFVQLLPGKLRSFTIASHHFIFLHPDSNAQESPAPGFYEVLYSGKVTALSHHVKLVKNLGKADEDLSAYLQYDSWYLLINDHYISIHNNKNLQNIFGSAAASRTFLRKNNLSFKKDPATTLAKTAEFLSQNKP